jgi:hypothetical protein
MLSVRKKGSNTEVVIPELGRGATLTFTP